MTDTPDTSPRFDIESSETWTGPRITLLNVLVILAIVVVLACLFLPVTRSAGPAARRSQCKNNLKQIALALYNYESTYGALPPACTVDADGKPLHSWRTLILPFLDRPQLYKTIDLSKPWNDPANAEAYQSRILGYECPSADCPENHTTYLAVVTSNGCFRQTEPRQFSEISDAHGETLMVIEVAAEQSVHWMSPMDAGERTVIGFGPDSSQAHAVGMHAAFVDGSVRLLEAEMPAAKRRALTSIAGNDN